MRKKTNLDWNLSPCCGATMVDRSGITVCPKCDRPEPVQPFRERDAPTIGTAIGARRVPVLNDESDPDFLDLPSRWHL
jgi:hypothetical protein